MLIYSVFVVIFSNIGKQKEARLSLKLWSWAESNRRPNK